MAKNLSVTNDKCYLSFLNEGEAVHIYSKADLQANPSLAAKIDIMYAYSENRICHMPSILLLLQKNIWVEQNSLPVLSIIPR